MPEGKRFPVTFAPGVLGSLLNRSDTRAYFLLTGDMSQMVQMEERLIAAGFPVVRSDVYPGFEKHQESEYRKALAFLFEHRVPGWWNQREAILNYEICTQEEFTLAREQARSS